MNNQTTPHRSSTDTMGREQNLAEALTSEPTQACVDNNAPLLSAAFCSAVDSTVNVGSEGFGGFRFSISHGNGESVATLDLCGATRREVSSNDLILFSMTCLKTAAKINGLL